MSIKPEKIKPGLHVCIDFKGNGYFIERGKVIRKLRKNWPIHIPDRDLNSIGGVNGQYSIPPNRLMLDLTFTKDGRALMANREDHNYMWSKEHIDYCKSYDHEEKKEPVKTCSICKKKFVGLGNNPQPVKNLSVDDRCCDDCNKAVVIPRRFREVDKEIN